MIQARSRIRVRARTPENWVERRSVMEVDNRSPKNALARSLSAHHSELLGESSAYSEPRSSFYNESFLESQTIQFNTSPPFRLILTLLFVSYTWTLILTAIPLFMDVAPNNWYAHHKGWYTGSDLIRFIEPIGTLPLQSYILYLSGGIEKGKDSKRSTVFVLISFMIGAAIYEQGNNK